MFRKTRLVPFVLCLASSLFPAFALPATAQDAAQDSPPPGALEGTVVTLDGTPVADARVEVVDLHQRQRTDDDGRFRFDGLRPGSYLLWAQAMGVGQSTLRVDVAGGEVASVELQLQLLRHDDEVVVTGSAVARSQLELSQPTTVLSGEELRFRQQATLGDTLSQEAGVSSTTFGAGASRPVIRGLGGDRVRMLQGGVGVGDASSTSPDHAVSVDPAVAERIEVLRGPATLLYGSSAIGGVVNVLDGRIPDHRPDDAFGGFLDVSGGTVADEEAVSVGLDGGDGDWAWHLDGSYRDAGDYEIPGSPVVEGLGDEHDEEGHDEGEEHEDDFTGVLENSDLRNESLAAGATRFFDRGFVGVSVSTFGSEYGIPGLAHAHEEEGEEKNGEEHGEEEEEGEEVRIDLERLRYDLRAEITEPFGAFGGFKARIGVTDYEHSELEGAEREVGTTFFNEAMEGRFELVQKERGGLTGSFGLQIGREDLEAVGAEAFLPPVVTENVALFAFEEYAIHDDLRLQFGARWESQDLDPEGPQPERSFDGISGSFGVVWEAFPGWVLASSLARSVKLPNGEELYSDGAHLATSDFEIGDPGLEEEVSLGLDVALRKTEGRLTGELSVFRNDFRDFIFKRFTGEEREGLPVVVYSQEDAEFWGAELQARLGLWQRGDRHVDLKLTADAVRAELDEGGYLPRIPPGRVGLGVHYHRPSWHLYGEVWDVASQDRTAVNETPTDGHTLVHAGVSWRYLGEERIYDVILRGRNLTDEEARNHVSFLKDQVLLPGRDVSLALRLTF